MKFKYILYKIFFSLLIVNSLTATADTYIIDSLKTELAKTNNDSLKIRLYNDLFGEQFFTNYKKALDYSLKAYELSLKKNIGEKFISESANNVGVSYVLLDKYELSLKYFLIALRDAEERRDTHMMSNSLYNLGVLYDTKGEIEKGLEYTIKAAELDEAIGDIESAAISYSSISATYFIEPDYDRAMDYYNKSMVIADSIGDEETISVLYSNRALGLKKLKRYEESLIYNFKAIVIDENLDDHKAMEISYLNIAELYLEMGKSDKSIYYNTKSLNLSLELNSTKNIMLAYASLSDGYKQKGEHKKALEYMRLHATWKDTLYNQENADAIAEMETKYETEKKQTENELLKTEQKVDKIEIDKQSNQQKMLLIVLALVVIVVLYVVYSLNQKKKTNKLLKSRNLEISSKNEIIEEKNKDITDSINYAKRIQQAILPSKVVLQNHFESFIYYRPKDIVSGDFYWIKDMGDRIYFAVVDCTGHGVPGAFMSIIGYNALNKTVEDLKIEQPGEILDNLNYEVNKALGTTGNKELVISDGMDISICCIDKKTNELSYAGANNSLYLLKNQANKLVGLNGVLENSESIFYEVKSDKMAIGGGDNLKKYHTHTFDIDKGDSVYLFSDGYADQFGGPKGKKFMSKPFKKLILAMQNETMDSQRNVLNKTITEWMGDLEQLDDICIVGVKA